MSIVALCLILIHLICNFYQLQCVSICLPFSIGCEGVHGPDYITSDNVQRFKECNIVDGSIIIVEATFTDSDKALNFSDLDVLQDVREVTGFVWINSMEVQNLRFLRNLSVIRGKYFASIHIYLNFYLPVSS